MECCCVGLERCRCLNRRSVLTRNDDLDLIAVFTLLATQRSTVHGFARSVGRSGRVADRKRTSRATVSRSSFLFSANPIAVLGQLRK